MAGPSTTTPNEFAVHDGVVYFPGSLGSGIYGLWRSDGTVAGTSWVADVKPSHMAEMNGRLFFRGYDEDNGGELWSSDGTTKETALLADLRPGYSSSYPSNLRPINGNLFFGAAVGDDNLNRSLVLSDGTAGGTYGIREGFQTVRSFTYLEGVQSVGPVTPLRGVILFQGRDYISGPELWRTDGSTEGTWMVKDIGSPRLGPGSPAPGNLVVVGERLLFSHDDDQHGRELWSSDGTEAGTWMVVDLLPGWASSIGNNRVAVGGDRLFFNAFDSVRGRELFRSDGTATGTTIFDLVPGPHSGVPQNLIATEDFVFFTADDMVNGRELWAVDIPFFRDGFEQGDTTSWSATVP